MSQFRDWGGYGAYLNEMVEDAREPDELVACPIDGEPLEENERGVLNCPRGNFQADFRPGGF